MVWISNLEQLRCFALYGAHRGRAAPGRLTLPDGRGLSTPDAAAPAVVDDSSPSFGGAAIVWWLWLPQCAFGAFPSSSNPSWLALSDGRGLGVLDAVVFAAAGDCYTVMVWTSNLEQLRCFALSGAHRGRAAPGRLIRPDGRGLSTPDAAASAVVAASPRHLAGLRLSGGFGCHRCASGAFLFLSSSP